jgi:hypothetical protein
MAHLVNKKLFMVAATKMTRIAFSNSLHMPDMFVVTRPLDMVNVC